MIDVKRNHRSFIITIILIVVYVALIGVIAFYGFNTFVESYAYFILFVLFIMTIFASAFFRTRLDAIINSSYLLKIRENQAGPITIKRAKDEESISTYLIKNEFEVFSKDDKHTLFYKITKDHIKKMLRGNILQIVVIVQPTENEFYLDIVDEEIQKIQNEYRKERKRIDKLLITQVKFVDELDETTKSQLTEIVFIRTQSSIVSTINVGIHLESNKAVMLYSDKFTPSMFYRFHIDQIKNII